jgi:flagellar hook-associated protein 3 FlgL
MSTNGVSSNSTFLMLQTMMDSNQTSLDKLSQQMSTGQVSSTLSGYGNQAQTVLNLAASSQTEQAYVQNNSVINTYLSAYGDSLTEVQNDATTLQGALQAFTVNDPTSVTNLQTVLTGVMDDLSATLNSQVGNRYIFSGTDSRLETSPVVDSLSDSLAAQVATGLPATAPTTTDPTAGFTLAGVGLGPGTPPTTTLPFYDTAYPGSTVVPPPPAAPTGTAAQASATNAYGTQTATVADNQQLTFGVSSNDPSIQALLYSVQNAYYAISSAQQATADPANATQLQANANTYVSNAESAANSTINGGTLNGVTIPGLNTLSEQVGDTQSTLTNVDAVQTQALANIQTQTSSVESVNTTNVATELSALENQLNASYKVTSELLNLSLLTFL